MSALPHDRALTDRDLLNYAKKYQIPHFRGVFMKDALPLKPRKYERAVVNLDNQSGDGTHWVAYKKYNKKVSYFDSFGNLQPPKEIKKYLRGCEIKYNHDRYQNYNTVICGQLCLQFLYK